MKKIPFTFLFILAAFTASLTYGQGLQPGECGLLFSYDATGSLIKREYICNNSGEVMNRMNKNSTSKNDSVGSNQTRSIIERKNENGSILSFDLSNRASGTYYVRIRENSQIEINPFIRYDNYPQYSYHYSGRVSTDYLKMTGVSYGISLSYKLPIKRKLFIKAGLGYFKYKFDKLDNTNTLTGESHVRPIDFISPLFILYSTDKYLYNNLMLRTGLGKAFDLNKKLSIVASFDLTAYYTFSQYYHLAFNPWDGNLDFNRKNKMLFGFSGSLSISILKQYKGFQIGPSLVVPIYDSWKKDTVFREEDYKGGKQKWLNGFGGGIVCNIFLHKRK